MERIEFSRLLNPREFTHLLLGHRKGTVFAGFCGVLLLVMLAVLAWIWVPDSLRASDIGDAGSGFGLDCNRLPGESVAVSGCKAADKALGDDLADFRQRSDITVDFDDNIRSAKGEADDDAQAFFKTYVCPVSRQGPMAGLDRGHYRFVYFLLTRNTGKTCGDKRLGARSRLVRTLNWSGAGIDAGGLLSALLSLVCVAGTVFIVFFTWRTRRAYLWLYGSNHVRTTE